MWRLLCRVVTVFGGCSGEWCGSVGAEACAEPDLRLTGVGVFLPARTGEAGMVLWDPMLLHLLLVIGIWLICIDF